MSKYSFLYDKNKVLEHIHSVLDGAFVNLYTYGYTYWELEFVSKELDTNKLIASELITPNPEKWWKSFNNPPIDLASKEKDADDTLSAMVLTHSMNSLVRNWDVHEDNSLEIAFDNNGVIVVPSVQDINLGFSWIMRTEKTEEASICNCDELYYRYRL